MSSRIVFYISLIFFAASCTRGGNEETEFDVDTIYITDAYPELEEEVIPVMEQLKMCSTLDSVLALPPCSNKYFRIFKYRPDRLLDEGFIVEMIPGLFNAPVHQVVVVEQYFGKYQIINQYFGHLIEMRTSPSGYNDLLIGYDDPEIGVVAIRHEWQGRAYDIVDVEDINGHRILPDFKDSINAIFLPAFAAGH